MKRDSLFQRKDLEKKIPKSFDKGMNPLAMPKTNNLALQLSPVSEPSTLVQDKFIIQRNQLGDDKICDDNLKNIMEYLPTKDLRKTALVNKRLNILANESLFLRLKKEASDKIESAKRLSDNTSIKDLQRLRDSLNNLFKELKNYPKDGEAKKLATEAKKQLHELALTLEFRRLLISNVKVNKNDRFKTKKKKDDNCTIQ